MSDFDRSTMRNMLHEVKRVAEHASLTGSLRHGTPVLVDVYNRCLATLKEQGDELVGNLLPTLSPQTDSVDVVGAAAALLHAYLATNEAPGFSGPGPGGRNMVFRNGDFVFDGDGGKE